jgi:hypothetical protein
MISYKSFDQSKLENSILNIYQLANRQENTEGLVWYEIANRFARTIARKHDISLVQTAAIIAALSPATHWAQNIIDTESLILLDEDASVTTYNRNKYKALKFLYGQLEPVDHYIGNAKYNWTKTASFFTNILNPTIAGKVTIDRHALRIAHGYELTADDAIYYGNTPKKYDATARAFITVAKNTGLLPHQLQAITWLAYRRLYVADRYVRNAARTF